jgi:hypothetical protein
MGFGYRSDSKWLACSDCASLVVDARYDDLVLRAVAAMKGRHLPVTPEVFASIQLTYQKLHDNMTGPPQLR